MVRYCLDRWRKHLNNVLQSYREIDYPYYLSDRSERTTERTHIFISLMYVGMIGNANRLLVCNIEENMN